jgi:hypothetical protein
MRALLGFTARIGRACARSMNVRMCRLAAGEHHHLRLALRASSIRAHCSTVIAYPSGWCPESAKQIGQSRLQFGFSSPSRRAGAAACARHAAEPAGPDPAVHLGRFGGSGRLSPAQKVSTW